MWRPSFLLVGLLAGWCPSPARADACGQLGGDRRTLAEKLFRSTYPYDCCDESLDRCLQQKRVCRLAVRLREEICKRVAAGQDEKRIKSALERRARSMMPGKRVSIDLSAWEPAGDPRAQVVVVAYACARCPFCARLIPDLHRLVSSGRLKGKVALYLKPFPISSHAGAKEGGAAMQAAARLKKLWPFTLKLYGEYDRFKVDRLP